MKRSEAYTIIDSERDYQDSKYPAINGVSATPEGFLLVIEELSTQARASVTQGKLPPLGSGSEIMEFIRKIGATAVRAIEQHGGKRREGF
jgi:hypothetical protein